MVEHDFSGYATKAGLRCTDGRTITAKAFEHMDGVKIPLVWQHMRDNPENVLGHFVLEHRSDGMYGKGYFNESPSAQTAKALLEHGDLDSLSIYANQLIEKSKQVLHGVIGEVSLVLAGANAGAKIDFVRVAHSDGEVDVMEDEAFITTGLHLEIQHSSEGDEDDESLEHAEDEDDDDELTIEDVYNSMNDDQKAVVQYMVGAAVDARSSSDGDAEHSADDDTDEESSVEHSDSNDDEDTLTHQEGNNVTVRNVFENDDAASRPSLSHSQISQIVSTARKTGSFKEAFLQHAGEYGIDNIDVLFPDAKAITTSPDFVKRRTEWVSRVLGGTKHSPFSRIKSIFADITADEARARGYIKGNLKKEEVFNLLKRVTTPTTIYKKQKLDRDDMVDITDFDVVQWLWVEMRLMLDEELAGAILVGDGRQVDDPDKIVDPAGASSGAGIRSIAHDDAFYAPVVSFDSSAAGWSPDDLIDNVVNALAQYEGSGSPTLFTTTSRMNQMLLQKDDFGRRLYSNRSEIAQLMGIRDIVDVPESIMARAAGVAGIIVNLQDYTIGTNAGGEISKFDDFDIDYNQYKYLLEGRCTGALTKYRSALILKDTAVPAGG